MYFQQRDSNFLQRLVKCNHRNHHPVILSYVEGYKIPFVEIPSQNSSPLPVFMKNEQKKIAQEEIEEMVKKQQLPYKTNQNNLQAQLSESQRNLQDFGQ